MKFFDKWNKGKFSIYKSEEKTVLKLIENINNFIGKLSQGVDNKTDLHGDHKGTWQGFRPSQVDVSISSVVESIKNDIDKIKKRTTIYNVMDFDFDNTGQIDISEKLNNLINTVSQNGGGIIQFPQGKFKVEKTIILKPYVYLMGDMPWRGKDEYGYTIFECYSLDNPQFLLREYTSLSNFYFQYPLQKDSDSDLPIPYEWTIKTDTTYLCDDIQLNNLYFKNSYKAISLVRGGRINLSQIYGQPILKGLYIDNSKDMNNIDRVEFWTFTYYVGTKMYKYIANNGTAFEFGKIDGIIANNMFAYGYNKAFNLTGNVWGTFTGCTADKCYTPINVDSCNIVEFIGGSFIGSSFKSTLVNIKNVYNSFKLIGANLFGGCSVGVLNYSNTGKIIIDSNFKNNNDLIKNAVINSGNAQVVVRKHSKNDKIMGNCIIDGIPSIELGNTIVYTFNKTNLGLSDSNVSDITNGFRINLGNSVSGEKKITGSIRIDNNENIPKGLYYLEMNISGKITTDRKRMRITIKKDDGSKIFNNIIDNLPFLESNTLIRIPIYLGEKPYITIFEFYVSYYDEATPTGDYIDITDMKLVRMGNKILNSTIENAYITSYRGEKKIDYSIT